ncbi:MAG: hypothetical protein KQH67_08750 [Bacteroidetes bacterium]|nr:hypothetical protein [Bacteroidota bacterium]
MKNLFLVMLAALTMLSCQKQQTVEQAKETDLGYGAFKYGEVVHTLYAGKTIDVGTVTVGIDDNSDYIYVKFETIPGWYIEETHVFVGPEGTSIPVNKPGNPKIGHFPFSTDHQNGDGTNVVTYPTIAYSLNQAFVVATHASVYNDIGQQETAWGYNDGDPSTNTNFSGKRWGWFQSFSYNGTPPVATNLFYMLQYDDLMQLLSIYQINLVDDLSDLISQEPFDAGSDGVLGASWNPQSNIFAFVSNTGTELWAIDFDYDQPAYFLGNISGVAQTGSFVGDVYYYIDQDNNVHAVSLDNAMTYILDDQVVGSIDTFFDIVDITASPDGESFYYLVNNGIDNEVWVYDINAGTTSSFANLGTGNFQIAFDADGVLYALEITPSPGITIHVFNEETGEFDDTNDSGDVTDPGVGDITPGPGI